jgi:uncharacterized hydrophobic protein (TIGR00341 family)
MAQRLIEIVVPEPDCERVMEVLPAECVVGRWRDAETGGLLIKAVIAAEGAEPILDELQQRFSEVEDFRVILLPVTASLPRRAAEGEPVPAVRVGRAYRISREELLAEAEESIRTSPIFVAMTVLSAVVASVGLLNDNLAVVIGAMMIAPLLAPNVILALGTTLGDMDLIRNALKANLVGVTIALLLSVSVGILFTIDPATPAVADLTVVNATDLLLAFAAGAAGTLAFTSGLPTAVIGVMVAVALLPPLVNFGMLIGAGQLSPAFGAFLLLVTNVICVNLAGVLTFLAQGIRPLTGQEAERARSSTRLATVIWAILLTLLAMTLFLSRAE